MLHGVVAVCPRSGSLLFAKAYTASFGLPTPSGGQAMDAHNLASLVFALQLNATSVLDGNAEHMGSTVSQTDEVDHADEWTLEELLNISHHGHPRPAFEEDTVITDVMWARDHFEAEDEMALQMLDTIVDGIAGADGAVALVDAHSTACALLEALARDTSSRACPLGNRALHDHHSLPCSMAS